MSGFVQKITCYSESVQPQGEWRQPRMLPWCCARIYGLWFLLPLVGSIVWFIKVNGELNEYWKSLGAQG